MGTCWSKKTTKSSSPAAAPLPNPPDQPKCSPQPEKKKAEEETLKKEIFIIKHRRSHEIDRKSDEEIKIINGVTDSGENSTAHSSGDAMSGGLGSGIGGGLAAVVRTSSCTKEEVESILIQCGRLSRSSSTGKAGVLGSGGPCENPNNNNNVQRGRKYSGSKRSYDFDHEIENGGRENDDNIGDDRIASERIARHRQRHRQARSSSSPSTQGRRRTPSRERDQQQQQQRSGSRERGNGGSSSGSGRRVSRSPGRRSESPSSNGNVGPISSGNANSNGIRPGKMVSVPATVSSLAMDKSNNGGGSSDPISAAAVKRIQVKRNSGEVTVGSRTAASPRARSPARVRTSGDNQNQQQPATLSRNNSRKAEQSPCRRNPLSEIDNNAPNINFSQAQTLKPTTENANNTKTVSGNVPVNVVVAAGAEIFKPQGLTRTRSSRRSHDLDINPETLLNSNPTTSYTDLLLEDIQNFHQKNTPSISLPPCLTKACSILEAVADLNSTTSSNLSDDRRRNPAADQWKKMKKREEIKDPFVESEVNSIDDLMEPTFQKYVTVRRGTAGAGDTEEQESSGSNSYMVAGAQQQQWVSSSSSSSSWEPNSADSTDRWNSNQSGIGRGRAGSGRGIQIDKI